MNQEHQNFLNLVRLPATIDAEQAGILLGISTVHVSILVKKRFLRPLGQGLALNAQRKFSSAAILKLGADPDEMNRMQQVLSAYWRCRNDTDSPRTNSSSKRNESSKMD